MSARARIPGVNAAAATDLPVLLPLDREKAAGPDPMVVSRWLASLPAWTPLVILAGILLYPLAASAASYTTADAFREFTRWLPFLMGEEL